MPDYFSLLGVERRPWLDADLVKQKFLNLSATAHPDRFHNASSNEKAAAAGEFADLNIATLHLTDHKLRVLHLLELESGRKPQDVQSIPNDLANLFTGVATACRNADQFLLEKTKATSPLLQVALFEEGLAWVEKLQQLQQNLNLLHANLVDRLKFLDAEWGKSNAKERSAILHDLEDLYRLFGYFNRWNNQIQERVVQLSF